MARHNNNQEVGFEDVEVLLDTGTALLVEIEEEKYWIPQSQVSEDSEVWKKGDSGRLVISRWIAKEKGLI